MVGLGTAAPPLEIPGGGGGSSAPGRFGFGASFAASARNGSGLGVVAAVSGFPAAGETSAFVFRTCGAGAVSLAVVFAGTGEAASAGPAWEDFAGGGARSDAAQAAPGGI